MRTVYHYVGRYGDEFQRTLDELKIKYTVSVPPFDTDEDPILIFDLKSDAKNFEDQYANVSMCAKPLTVWSDYTKKEIESSPWVSITPCRHCVDIENYNEAMFYYCRKIGYPAQVDWIHDQEQIEDFKVSKAPKRTRTVFYSGDTGIGDVFVDERLKQMVEANGLRGVVFRRVLTKKGIERNDLFQLTSETIVPRERIALGHGERFSECSYCYSKQIILDETHPLYLKGSADDLSSDFYVTARIFGEGVAHPYYLMSKRFYQCLKNERMLYSLRAKPVCFEG